MKYILPLLALVPIALILEFAHIGGPTAVFAASALSLIPLAGPWLSVLLGNPMTLVFNSYELAGLIGAALIAVLISVDGESHWLEGLQLLTLYLMLGIAFYFVG